MTGMDALRAAFTKQVTTAISRRKRVPLDQEWGALPLEANER